MTTHIKLHKPVYIAIAIYLVWVCAYVGVNYQQEKQRLFASIDRQLDVAAQSVPLLLPEDFHHQAMAPGEITRKQSLGHAVKLSEFTRLRDVIFIYSLILREDKVYFTASSATEEEIASGEGITYYFDHYDDVDPEVINVFGGDQKAYIEYTDQWGTFRSVFIPQRATDGSVYVAAADIEISHINGLLKIRLLATATIAALFLLFAIPLMAAFSFASRRLAQQLERRVEARTEELANSEKTLNSILEHSPVGIVHYDKDGRLLKVNKAFENIVHLNRSQLNNAFLVDCVDNDIFAEAMRSSLNGQLGQFEGEIFTAEQQRAIILHANFSPMTSAPGLVTGGVAVFDDRTEQHETLLSLKKLSLAVENSPTVVFITDRDGVIEYANARFTEVTEFSVAEVIGKTPRILKSGQRQESDYKALWTHILSGKPWSGEFQNRRKSGEIYWSRENIAPIVDASGEITHFVAIQEDITESRRVHEENRYYATHDMLTGLVNRYELERRLTRVVKTAKQSESTHAMCFVDLDQFKIINDTCGHVAGDELLRQLASLLKSHLRKRDTLARIGGDEFALLMEHCDLEQAQKVAKNLHQVIDQFVFCWGEHNFSIGSCIGLTVINQYTHDANEVLKHADAACYMAKEQGRNRINIYREDDESLTRREGEMQWVNVLKRALAEEKLTLFAQVIEPIAEAESKISFEVLLRLRDDDGKLVPPGSFLPAAERYNLSTAIDRWVVEHTFTWIEENLSRLAHVDHLAINLSGQSLGDEDFLNALQSRLQGSTIPTHMICFEITETAAIANLAVANQFISVLQDQGCHFALDDFGSGLSSFAYLKNLPVDYLKIDGMFVKDMLADPINEAMVKSINDIGQIMQISTIAEFVENTEIHQRLQAMGVDFVQGYAVGKPLPLETILDHN